MAPSPAGGDPGPQVFVHDLGSPELSEDDAHHLVRVLRTGIGDPIVLSDGRGRWCGGRVTGREGTVEAIEEPHEEPVPAPALTVAFAPVKGGRTEWAVQKLTEIGVDRVVPVLAERSVVRWSEEQATRQVARLRRVAREAAMQSRRCRLPVVESPRPAVEMLTERGAATAQRGAAPLSGSERTLVIGPEGGWSAGELDRSPTTVGLGPNRLRTETAALVGAALMVALRGGFCHATTKGD